MLRFTLRRLALSLVTLFILIFVVFMMTWLTPGDTARRLAGPFAAQERVDALNEQLGLDDPFFVQFWNLLLSVVTLDCGESFSSPGVQVIDLVQPARQRLLHELGAHKEIADGSNGQRHD